MPKIDHARITAFTGHIDFVSGGDDTVNTTPTTTLPLGKNQYPHNIYGFYPGTLEASQIVFRIIAANRVRFAANFDGSFALCDNPPVDDLVLNITINDDVAGTLHMAAGTTSGVFQSGDVINLVPGDIFAMIASDSSSSMAGLTFTLKGAIVG